MPNTIKDTTTDTYIIGNYLRGGVIHLLSIYLLLTVLFSPEMSQSYHSL